MMADAVRHDQVDQKSDHAVSQAQEVEISMLEVDPRANIAARKRDHHQKPIGRVHERKAYSGQDGDAACVIRQKTGKAVHKIAIEYVLLKQTPGAIEEQA